MAGETEAICLLDPLQNFTIGNESEPCTKCIKFKAYLLSQSSVFHDREMLANSIMSAYIIISLIGSISNSLVVLAMIRCPHLRNTRNFFILNLAISDFLMCTLTAPFTLHTVLNNFWPFGDIACGMIAAAQGVSIIVSSLSLTGIGLDRYILIIFPTRFQGHGGIIVAYLVLVWAVSLAICMPYFIATSTVGLDELMPELREYYSPCGEHIHMMCAPLHWDRLPFGKMDYTVAVMVIQYFFPLCTLFLIYCHIGRRISKRGRVNYGASRTQDTVPRPVAGGPRRQSIQQARQRRTLWLLTALVINFAVLWLPFNIYNLLVDFEVANWNMVRFACCHLVAMLTACANPVLYGLLNENFRVEFMQMYTSVRGFLKKKCLCHVITNREVGRDEKGVKTMGNSGVAYKRDIANGDLEIKTKLDDEPRRTTVIIDECPNNMETSVLLRPEPSSSQSERSTLLNHSEKNNNELVSVQEDEDEKDLNSPSLDDTHLLDIKDGLLDALDGDWEPSFIDDDDDEFGCTVLTPDSVPLVSAESNRQTPSMDSVLLIHTTTAVV